jgi:gamma-glutamylcyclotransferase (GGCT)/AIG2-like uncharacterized protein YtfP
MPELLAVYGTLMAGQAYDGRPDVETLLRPAGPCRIPGALYTEGAYPWLVDAPGAVSGELYEVVADGALELLDAYEGDERHTGGTPSTYERRLVRLLEPDVEAWVYVWVGEPRGEPIADGDWIAFQAIRGDR